MRLAARIVGLFLAILILFTFTKTSLAQVKQNPTFGTQYSSTHLQTQNIMIEVMSSLACQLSGVDPIKPSQPCFGIDRESGKIGFVKNGNGVVGALTTMIKKTFLVPVHFSDYVAYTSNNFGIVKKTYAQGIGFVGLQPVLGLYTIFRNLSYVLLVFVFVVIGVAIMLRLKIDPRTVMTVQNQIPKLIIGLVMITFSYAIAGLLIDMMWVSTYFVINTIAPAEQQPTVIAALTQGVPGFASSLFSDKGGLIVLARDASSSVGDLIKGIFSSPSFPTLPQGPTKDCGLDIFCHVGGFIESSIQTLMSAIVATLLSIVASIIAFLIFMIAILVQLFKLWFALIKAFVSILLDVMLAPFWILAGLLPGAGPSVGIGAWLRDLAANLAVFPAVVFLFLVARIIMQGFTNVAVTSGEGSLAFNPPLIGNATTNPDIFAAIIAVGFILSAPSFVETVKKAFKSNGLGGGMGGLSAGQAATAVIAGGIGGRLYRRDPRTGEVKGAVGTRVQSFFGESVQGKSRYLRGVGRFTLGVEKTENVGRTLRDVRESKKSGGNDGGSSSSGGTPNTPPTTPTA